jgi:hypothetical protein
MSWLASLDSARAAIRSCSRIIARSDSRTTMRDSLPPAALAGTLSPSPMITSGLSLSAMVRAMALKHWTFRSMRTRAFEPDRVRRCAIAALVCCVRIGAQALLKGLRARAGGGRGGAGGGGEGGLYGGRL